MTIRRGLAIATLGTVGGLTLSVIIAESIMEPQFVAGMVVVAGFTAATIAGIWAFGEFLYG